MAKEKFIYERKSTVKGRESVTVAYVVQIPYYEHDGSSKKRKQYVGNFKVSDYITPAAALKAAIRERDRMTPLLKGIQEGDSVYYVHSFYAKGAGDAVKAASEYGVMVPGLVQKGNVFGAQFHPEKSGPVGLKMLKAFGEEKLC